MYKIFVIGVFAIFAFANQSFGQNLNGKWNGTWYSQSNGHKGNLKATIRQVDACNYRAVFTGTFFKIIPFRYRAKLKVVGRDGNQVYLSGGKKLGPVLGDFRYDAVSNGQTFSATFRSKRDHGVWNLRRRN